MDLWLVKTKLNQDIMLWTCGQQNQTKSRYYVMDLWLTKTILNHESNVMDLWLAKTKLNQDITLWTCGQ